jgi:hypothetical protein
MHLTFLLPRLSKSVNDLGLLITGCIILTLSFGELAFPPDWAIYLSAILNGLGNGLMWPTFFSGPLAYF